MSKFFGLAALCLMGSIAADAKAGLLPVHVGTAHEGSNYRYTYSILLESDSMLKKGDYFTVYDFAGLISGSNQQPAGFSYSTSATGRTPGNVLPQDDGSMANLTWTYVGDDSLLGQKSLGDFSALSRYGRHREDSFTGQSHRVADGHVNNNITDTHVPVPTYHCGVPEPTTLVLLGLGVPFALGFRAMRRRPGHAQSA